MIETYENYAVTSLEVERIIGHIQGSHTGPTVIFFGGIHGNEPAGVLALKKVFPKLDQEKNNLFGECYAIAGNLEALRKGVRFIDEDLNRIWFPERLERLNEPESFELSSIDAEEMRMLHKLISDILHTARPPFYFIDLHTTSGETEPFIVVNDSLLNRRFISNYPFPIILGIEEYLTGAMLSYINELGYVAFGYESGQHQDPRAITNAEDFIWYTLGLTGLYSVDRDSLYGLKMELGGSNKTFNHFYEIYHQHLLNDGDYFKMLPGFVNFQKVPKGEYIAKNNNGAIITKKARQLFMPLYQDKGTEGFYFIRSIPRVFLTLSKYLRKLKADALLAGLPGVRWANPKKDALFVDVRIARFFAKSLFHLLGYRARQKDKNHIVLKNRERSSRKSEYKDSPWD